MENTIMLDRPRLGRLAGTTGMAVRDYGRSHRSMNKSDFKYQPNLAFREFNVPAGEEWQPRLAGWSLVFIRQGSGYCLQPRLNRELETGTALLLAGPLPGSIRASQLGELSFCCCSIIPDRLTALISLDEQHRFRLPPDGESIFKILPADHPLAIKMSGLMAENNRDGLLFRLKLLQLFAELFVEERVPADFTELKADDSDAMKRLQQLLQKIPAAELVEMDFNELAVMTHCTTRHLTRIFYKLVGTSFSEKRAEIRLARAEELLATGNSKVVQVAFDSGYNSLSQFNLMFIRRYGVSPGKWREKFGQGNLPGRARKIAPQLRPAGKIPSPGGGILSLNFAGKRNSNGQIASNRA
jgi:AraC-like DNA-binding protein